MSDTLASINVDQLSNAVNAVVQPADSSTQQDNSALGGRTMQNVKSQFTGSNLQLQVPNLPVGVSNTVTLGNNAVPVMLVRVANPSNQLSNQLHSLPLSVTNQMQTVPVARAVAPTGPTNANIVGQLGNVAIALQPKTIPIVQPAPVQTLTLPNVNQTAPSVSTLQANPNTVATDLLNLTAAQNVTFGNILSVQQKPSSDVLVLNPTGLQLNSSNNTAGNMTSSALTGPSTSNTFATVSATPTSQSPAVNLNLNINLPSGSTQQLQQQQQPQQQLQQQQVIGSAVQTIQTTPVKTITQPLGPRFQLSQPVFQQVLQPTVIPSNSIMPSSVINFPVAGLLSPNNVVQQTQASVPLQMAPILQAVPAVGSSPSVKVIPQQPTSVVSQIMMPLPASSQISNQSVTQMPQVYQTIASQNNSTQLSQTSQAVTYVVPSVPQAATCTATSLATNTAFIQQKSNMRPQTEHSSNVSPQNTTMYETTSQVATHHASSNVIGKQPELFNSSEVVASEHAPTLAPQQAASYATSHMDATESLDPTDAAHTQFAHDIASLAANWHQLQITQSATTTTLTSTSPQASALESTTTPTDVHGSATSCPTDIHGSNTTHEQSLPLNISCDDSVAAQSSLALSSVTSHLTSILSDLARPISSSSEPGQEAHLQDASNQYHHHQQVAEVAQNQSSLHLTPADGANNLMSDPVSTASMVAGVSADDMESLDITIPPSLAGLSVVAADFLHDEIVTGVWCIDCNKYNDTTCTKHGSIVFIRDSLIESRAKQTLPKILEIKPSKIAAKFVGVFASEMIQVRTQFGPLQGKIVSRDEEKTLDVESPLVWKIYSDGNLSHYIDTTDERVSNWMMFVKLARTEKDQNLVAHQQGGAVYFTTIKTIECGEELYVWYCKDYTMWQGVPTKPEDSFACHLCPMQFSKVAQLKSHNKYSHANMTPRRWKCNMCVRSFHSQSKLNVHILVHMGVRPHRCEHCNKTFTDPSNLRQHKLIHTGVRKFTCTLCNKSFRQKAHLESHLVVHTGEKKLKCKYCDMYFARPNDVTQHMYKHTKEKEVDCDICGRTFWRKGHMKKHMKMHTGERNYHCALCKKAFLTSYHLKRHMQSCKGPKGSRSKSSTTSKKGDVAAEKNTAKSVRTSSSRGRTLKPKPPFTIEARPSRLRRKGPSSSSSSRVASSPSKSRIHLDTQQISDGSSSSYVAETSEVTSSGTVDLVPEVMCDKSESGVEPGEGINIK